MEHAELKNKSVLSILDKVLRTFDSVTFENFDNVFPVLVSSMKRVNLLKNEMKLRYGSEKLLVFEKEAFFKAKLIEEKFDNLVATFTEEERRLENELRAVLKKKKLTAYIR